jgi:aspartyl-tRNA(Asn)/glutamyl-tRNA(Gln) amidotransferase subunit B
LLAAGGDPDAVAARLGFEAMGADDLAAVVDRVIGEHPAEWERYRAGEDKLTGFLIGHIKSATDGNADLKAASALLRARRG